MQTAYSRAIADRRTAKHQARSNADVTREDKALALMVTAENHAKAVDRFMQMADGERQLAAMMASYGQTAAAGQAEDRAREYHAIAQRHAAAAADYQKRSEDMAGTGQPQQPPRQRRQQPPPAPQTPPTSS
jgi:hypothetical protein